MLKEKLIEELQKLPDGIEVCILDKRRNLNHRTAPNINNNGYYPIFSVIKVQEYPVKEVVLEFENYDYDEDGNYIKNDED